MFLHFCMLILMLLQARHAMLHCMSLCDRFRDRIISLQSSRLYCSIGRPWGIMGVVVLENMPSHLCLCPRGEVNVTGACV